MKISNVSGRMRRTRSSVSRRGQLLAAFERSGLSAAAFARQHGVNYTTFCGWRSRFKAGSAFVEVEMPIPKVADELTIELGPAARMRITSVEQVALAARLLQALNTFAAC